MSLLGSRVTLFIFCLANLIILGVCHPLRFFGTRYYKWSLHLPPWHVDHTMGWKICGADSTCAKRWWVSLKMPLMELLCYDRNGSYYVYRGKDMVWTHLHTNRKCITQMCSTPLYFVIKSVWTHLHINRWFLGFMLHKGYNQAVSLRYQWDLAPYREKDCGASLSLHRSKPTENKVFCHIRRKCHHVHDNIHSSRWKLLRGEKAITKSHTALWRWRCGNGRARPGMTSTPIYEGGCSQQASSASKQNFVHVFKK
jgi:hypothetical protein